MKLFVKLYLKVKDFIWSIKKVIDSLVINDPFDEEY